jgi:hypothetical protein
MYLFPHVMERMDLHASGEGAAGNLTSTKSSHSHLSFKLTVTAAAAR